MPSLPVETTALLLRSCESAQCFFGQLTRIDERDTTVAHVGVGRRIGTEALSLNLARRGDNIGASGVASSLYPNWTIATGASVRLRKHV